MSDLYELISSPANAIFTSPEILAKIAKEYPETTDPNLRNALMDIHNATLDFMQAGIKEEELAKFLDLRRKHYIGLLVYDMTDKEGEVIPEKAIQVTDREIAAGRMKEDDPLRQEMLRILNPPTESQTVAPPTQAPRPESFWQRLRSITNPRTLSMSPEVKEIYLRATEQGDKWAYKALGDHYREGKGVTQNHAEAVKWYRLAAEKGLTNAAYILGEYFFRGPGVKKDIKESIKWFRIAAANFPTAATYIGHFYTFGEEVPLDYKEAAKWFLEAALQDEPLGQYSLGVCYSDGNGVPQSFQEAEKWWRLAALRGNQSAQRNLGHIFLNGRGVAQSLIESYAWYSVSAAAGHIESSQWRDDVARSLTSFELEIAQKRGKEYYETAKGFMYE